MASWVVRRMASWASISGHCIDSLPFARQAVEVGGVVETRAVSLRLPDHLREAIHDVVPRLVHRAAADGEGFEGSADSRRLVDGDLLLDGEVHRDVQEGIGLAALGTPLAVAIALAVAEHRVVFRVLDHD